MDLLPPATKLGQGYIFTGICDSVHRGVVSQHTLQQVSRGWGCIPACIAGGIQACFAAGLRGVPDPGGSASGVLRYDTIGKIELNPSFLLSSDNTNYKNDIQLFHQLFDELSVYRDYH